MNFKKDQTRLNLRELNDFILRGIFLSNSNSEKSIQKYIVEVMKWFESINKDRDWGEYHLFTVGPIELDGEMNLHGHSTLLEYRAAKLKAIIDMLQTMYNNEKTRREHKFTLYALVISFIIGISSISLNIYELRKDSNINKEELIYILKSFENR